MPAEDREAAARRAAQAIYSSMSDNGSTRSATSWDVTTEAGQSCCGCRRPTISPIRRTFCLFAVFDLVLAFILWVIYKQVTPQYKLDLTSDDFNFNNELFDTVLLAFGRFIILISSYALFRSRRPWAVAVTTFATSVVLVVQAVVYNWQSKGATMFVDMCVLVVSFIISWVETWLLDFKVLPWEEKQRARAQARLNGMGHDSDLGEDDPLLPRRVPRIYGPSGEAYSQSSRHEHFRTPNPEGDGGDAYYSFLPTPSGSPPADRFLSLPGSQRPSRVPSLIERDPELLKYARDGKEALMTAWRLLAEPVCPDDAGSPLPDGWKAESSSTSGDASAGRVFSKQIPNKGKIFRMSAVIDASATTVFSIIVDECEKTPEWNPTLLEVRILLPVNDSTKVAYNVAAAAVGGVVSSRDFVYIMHNVQKDGWYVSAYVSTEYAAMPPQKNYVRGEQRPGLTRIRDLGPNSCQLETLLDTNLNGWLPQYLIDQAMASVMLDYLKHLKQRCSILAKESTVPA